MTTRLSLGGWLGAAARQLANVSDRPLAEAQLLAAQGVGQARAWIAAHNEVELDLNQCASLDFLLQRRVAGEPLPYVLGWWEFYGLRFSVTRDVLIPRPETECLVESALTWLQHNPSRRRVGDVGTGSGCIAGALLVQIFDLQMAAVDISRAALRVAAMNLNALGVAGRAGLVQSNLLSAFGAPFDLVCANLPYIPTGALDGLSVAQHEPRGALDGGEDGLCWIGELLSDAPRWMAVGGRMLLEIEAGQGQTAVSLAEALVGRWAVVHLRHDLAGLPRFLQLDWKG